MSRQTPLDEFDVFTDGSRRIEKFVISAIRSEILREMDLREQQAHRQRSPSPGPSGGGPARPPPPPPPPPPGDHNDQVWAPEEQNQATTLERGSKEVQLVRFEDDAPRHVSMEEASSAGPRPAAPRPSLQQRRTTGARILDHGSGPIEAFGVWPDAISRAHMTVADDSHERRAHILVNDAQTGAESRTTSGVARTSPRPPQTTGYADSATMPERRPEPLRMPAAGEVSSGGDESPRPRYVPPYAESSGSRSGSTRRRLPPPAKN